MTLPASGQKWLDTLETMRAAIAELAAERDEHRDRSDRYGSRIDELLKERTKAEVERDAAVAKCAELERIAEQSRREGQEIAAGLHERIAELERDLADDRKDIADAQLVLPACCGSLADAASTLKQERDELERMLRLVTGDLNGVNAALAAAKQAMESLGYLTGHVGHIGDHDVLTLQVNAATAQRWNRAYQAIAAAEQGGA